MGFFDHEILRFFGRETWILRVQFPRGCTLQGTNISPQKGPFEDDFPFPKVGYVNSLEGNCLVWFVRLGLSVAGGADKQLGKPSWENLNRGEGVKEFQ